MAPLPSCGWISYPLFYGMQQQIAAMTKTGGGAIVNMASVLAAVGFASSSVDTTAKHGVVGLTQAAALAYSGKGIRRKAKTMKRQLAAYVGTMIVMVGLDLLWLGIIAKPLDQQGIGHLMADKQWPVGLSLIDMAWGTCVSAAAAVGGKTLMDWAAPVWQPTTHQIRYVRQRADASSPCANRQFPGQ